MYTAMTICHDTVSYGITIDITDSNVVQYRYN